MKARIINMTIWAVLAVVLATLVVVEWNKNDVSLFGLLVGAAWYVVACAGMWFVADQTIKEAQE